jgi:hypothetical protein
LSHHPDKPLVSKLLQYLDEGVPILYDGPNFNRVCPNWKSVNTFNDAVKKMLVEDVQLGRKSGPFSYPPVPNFVGSPLGAFEKKRTGKIRVIHDLSWPPYFSVNTFIDPLLCSVSYVSIDNAVKALKLRGRHSLMSKIDLKDAYKNIMVRPDDWHHLGSTWVNESGETEFFIDHVLPFGLRSSAMLFDLFASALEFSMYVNKCSNVIHYLDDFYTCGKAGTSECASNLSIMLQTCEVLGMPVNPAKVVQPVSRLEFLGIIIDADVMELQMSQERLDDIFDTLREWSADHKGSKRSLLSLLGKLIFLCRIVKPGRIFVRRLFDLAKSVKCLHHHVRLSREASADVKWWLRFCVQWNHKSLFYDDDWIRGSCLKLSTDASGCGIGRVFGRHWYSRELTAVEGASSIAFRELLAVVTACACWGELLSGRRVLLECDNSSVVFCVNQGTSKSPPVMDLIRNLFFIAARFSFDLRLVHVAGVDNVAADLLSRLRVAEFAEGFPDSDVIGAVIPSL